MSEFYVGYFLGFFLGVAAVVIGMALDRRFRG